MRRAVLVCALFTLACPRPERPSGSAGTSAVATAPGSSESREEVVARIADRLITYGELEDRLNTLPVFVRVRYQAPERKLEFLEAYVQFQLLALAAMAEVQNDGSIVDALKAELVEHYLREQVDVHIRSTDIPEEEVRQYYESHLDRFNQPERMRVMGLRVGDRGLAKKLARRARRTVAVSGLEANAAILALIEKHSDDEAVKKNGGEIGLFPRLPSEPSMVPEAVEQAASQMTEVGQVVGPIEASDGFHVLYCAARVPAVHRTLDEARGEVIATLVEERRMKARKEFIERLVAQAQVEVP